MQKTKQIGLAAKAYIAATAALAVALTYFAYISWQVQEPLRLVCYLILGSILSAAKIRLPGMTGTMSIGFLVSLMSIAQMSVGETMLIVAVGTLIQIYWRPKVRPSIVQLLFGLSSGVNAAAIAHFFSHWVSAHFSSPIVGLMLSASISYFALNTFPVAAVVSLTESRPLFSLWKEYYFWSLPYFILGAALIGNLVYLLQTIGWEGFILVAPLAYTVYYGYSKYMARLEAEKQQVEEMAGLHLRTIEALATAIEAKDQSAVEDLKRVEVYSTEIAKRLRLGDDEILALRAASLLHDIGKLAVPEHIINKPGRLTHVEFERMKIHPVVGAQILKPVGFPYPVVPIVRHHHERWDGSGYPDGLKREEIPIGARILAAADCLDAMVSPRQYRDAMPLDEVVQHLVRESGKSYDPNVVAIIAEHYHEFEELARKQHNPAAQNSQIDLKLTTTAQPEAGFEESMGAMAAGVAGADFRSRIAEARQEAQALFELSRDLGNSLSLNDTLSFLSMRLKRIVPFDTIVVSVCRDNVLVPEFVSGENSNLFSSLRIPFGEGLAGWVAENNKPICNGNPSVESGYLNDDTRCSPLRSALAVPLEGLGGVIGVLSLYKAEKDYFSNDHLRILLAVANKLALSIENALRYQQAENIAITDSLTGLPNARSLSLQLDHELARCRRNNTPLTVIVCDLNGFKAVNDRFGHLEGNRLLKKVAENFRLSCREYDYVARMGGDEFVILLPGVDAIHAQGRKQRFVEVTKAAGFEITGEQIVSASMGIAYFPSDGSDAEELLALADRRMYKEKNETKAARIAQFGPHAVR